jgi:diguanylate cyclase (GGDEF)-like protein
MAVLPKRNLKIKKHYFRRFPGALLKKWRFYGLKTEDYRKCTRQNFANNLYSLRQANFLTAVLAAVFSPFSIIVEGKFIKAVWYLSTALIALFMGIFINHKCNMHNQGKTAGRRFIYAMITAYYVNVIAFGIYMGVWANPGKIAVTFMGILICALFFFIVSPLYTLTLTLCSMAVFITAAVIVKPFSDWSLDLVNVLFAGFVSLFINWQSTMSRMSLITAASRFEDERDSYYHQSTVDELTQLKNRRNFTQTFHRFLTTYRQSDKYLCIALLDIDFFKNYNDHYGHLMGDDCLRAIGRALRDLHNSTGIYNARVGGEEFAMIWFESKADDVRKITSRVNQMIIDLNIPHAKSEAAPYITVSIGVHVTPCSPDNDMNELYDLADKALYTAKSSGRNKAVITMA